MNRLGNYGWWWHTFLGSFIISAFAWDAEGKKKNKIDARSRHGVVHSWCLERFSVVSSFVIHNQTLKIMAMFFFLFPSVSMASGNRKLPNLMLLSMLFPLHRHMLAFDSRSIVSPTKWGKNCFYYTILRLHAPFVTLSTMKTIIKPFSVPTFRCRKPNCFLTCINFHIFGLSPKVSIFLSRKRRKNIREEESPSPARNFYQLLRFIVIKLNLWGNNEKKSKILAWLFPRNSLREHNNYL